eukprot:CAMPEP_0174906748 /NCGR_PEP_ID=MMETSP0167-20121228/58227_1 /TAXON_ID=38298 /ORGANISM="Rhodella maculata, Strain CCMP736" /LENGTH=186 /DNA_ID=CAMNT_0016150049 /DNA_START=604 /DNA_END=1160 /DNA_ORIENTATION=-
MASLVLCALTSVVSSRVSSSALHFSTKIAIASVNSTSGVKPPADSMQKMKWFFILLNRTRSSHGLTLMHSLHIVQLNGLATLAADILQVEDLSGTHLDELLRDLAHHVVANDFDLGDHSVKRGGDRAPLCVDCAGALRGKHVDVDALARAQLRDENIVVDDPRRVIRVPLRLLLVDGLPLDVARVH